MPKTLERRISKKKLFELCGYHPHSEGQWSFHNSKARFRIPTCGRRWGKSTSAGMDLLAEMFVPESIYWIVGPDYQASEKEFRVVYRALVNKLNMGDEIKATYNVKQGDMRIEMPWNTLVVCKSAKLKDSLVGEGLSGVIMSEAAQHDRATWEMFIRPALTDSHGWATFPSTPRGFNWYEGLWRLGQQPEDVEYESWKFPSWTNPVVYPGGRTDPELLSVEDKVSRAFFKQEIGAEFTAFEGQIYEDFDRTIHVRDIEYNPRWENYRAFDFGFTNPFVCLDIMVDPSENVYVWREYYVSGRNNHEHGLILRDRQNPPGYHVDDSFGDPRDPDAMSTLSPIIGYVHGEDVPWENGIEAVARLLKVSPVSNEPRLFIDRSCIHTIEQMEQLRKPTEREGRETPEGQHKHNDHTADAVRYFAGQRFFLGGGGNLAAIYGQARARTEAEGFFRANSVISGNQGIRY